MEKPLSAAAMAAAGAVDEARLWQSLMDLARFGARDDGGVCRHALSDEDIAARAHLIGWAGKRGYRVSVDAAANLFFRRAGSEPGAEPVLTGSHMDSQPAGGKFDGAYGVLAALEALAALDDAAVATRRPIDAVAWTNEEGGRFDRSCTGSSVWSGAMPLEGYLDDIGADGVTLRDALARTLAATPDLPRRDFAWNAAAYIEPHIEQGPVLETEGISIAAVTSIQGVRWFNVEVTGKGGHAGTTPVAVRRDALQAALRIIDRLNRLMADPDDIVRFTVGRMTVEPNSPNTVPSRVAFSIDLRHPDAAILAEKTAAMLRIIETAPAPCVARAVATSAMEPALFPEPIPALIETAASALGLKSRRLASGAFHDALLVARKCPAGMLFIPCRDGLSHDPAESAEPAHCAAGARVLAAALVELADG